MSYFWRQIFSSVGSVMCHLLLRQVHEPDPSLSVLNAHQFFTNFLLAVSCLFNNLPKLLKLCEVNLSVVVHIYCLEKRFCGLFSETKLVDGPVLDCFCHVDLGRVVNIEGVKCRVHFLDRGCRKHLLTVT